MKNLKKLVIASFMLVIAFVAVVSSTYAWFTQSSDASVNNITIGVVDANKSLLVSRNANAANQEEVIWGKAVSFNFTGKFTPVTINTKTAGQVNFDELKLDDSLQPYMDRASQLQELVAVPESGDEAIAAANAANAAARAITGYAKFDLWFQIDAKDNAELLNTSIDMQVELLNALNPLEEGQNTQTTNDKAISSFRMAIANEASGGALSVLRVIEGAGTGRYGTGEQFAKTNAWMARYAATPSNYELNGSDLTVAAADQGAFVELVGNANAYTLLSGKQDAAYTNTTTIVSPAVTTVEGENAVTTNVAEYTITEDYFYANNATNYGVAVTDQAQAWAHIVVFVWMEGWDGDCVNAASGCEYIFKLTFQVK